MKASLTSILLSLFLNLFLISTANSQTNDANKNKSERKQTDKPLIIKSKASPDINFFRKCFDKNQKIHLTVRVRVTFHSSEKVTDVEMAEPSSCEYFNNEILRVAKKIKFKPAIKNGEHVTLTKLVEYNAGSY